MAGNPGLRDGLKGTEGVPFLIKDCDESINSVRIQRLLNLPRPATCLTQPLHVFSLLPTLPQPTERCRRALNNLDVYRRQFMKVVVCGIVATDAPTIPLTNWERPVR